jgi:hypothetical protein
VLRPPEQRHFECRSWQPPQELVVIEGAFQTLEYSIQGVKTILWSSGLAVTHLFDVVDPPSEIVVDSMVLI